MSEPTSSSYRCPTCKSSSDNGRNLAVFIDGTSNGPGDEETNVRKLYNLVSNIEDPELKLKQHAHYLKGIGVHDADNSSRLGRAGKWIHSGLEKMFACNVEKNVMEGYVWLAENYREGDQIYLFGFSRGAYQVRALAAMIHEVGLVEEPEQNRIEQARRNYRSINPSDPETRTTAIQFKKVHCRPGVRIHFVGVWDTVSSLGFIKQNVHITASACVTNACYFRHALALDERRVKFIPEYFSEVNARHLNIESPRLLVRDVKEVWFAGHHSDVGGTSRPHAERSRNLDAHKPVHAGNVSLLWMIQEAAENSLLFTKNGFSWGPEDVDLGRKEEMNIGWKLLEILPIRHQVGFSGVGKHARRFHLFGPRSVIPHQHIHSSVLSGDVYMPRAALRGGVNIPTVPRITSGGIWITELPEEATVRSLTSLLDDPEIEALVLLGSDGQTSSITRSQCPEEYISKQSDFARFALSVIYDVTSDFSITGDLLRKARNSLSTIMTSPSQPYFPRTLEFLRSLISNETLKRRFIANEEVVGALLCSLERTTESQRERLFPLVMDILCYLISDDDQRGYTINQLNVRSALSETGKTRLSLVLEVKVPSHLVASLRMIASLARYQPFPCKELKPRITHLAKKGRGPVGPAAVEALVALDEPLTRDIPFSNLLRYIDNTLPRLDAEGCSSSSAGATVTLPPVFRANGPGGVYNKEITICELLRAIESRDSHQCTTATLTLLKLCNNPTIWDSDSQNKALDIFTRQLEKKETSLLAAYALKTCLKHGERNQWTTGEFDFGVAAELIVDMFKKGWFDDAVGQVEGSEIFRELTTLGDLKQRAIRLGIVATLIKKFEGGKHHDVRMGLICLDILDGESQVIEELAQFVNASLAWLWDEKRKTQMKGVRVLSALAQTRVGEELLKSRVIDIVMMLLPRSGQSSVPRSQLFGPAATVHNLCRNETLRKEIEESPEYAKFKDLRRNDTLYPKSATG